MQGIGEVWALPSGCKVEEEGQWGGKNIIVKYTSEDEATAWDTLNAQADDKQEPTE